MVTTRAWTVRPVEPSEYAAAGAVVVTAYRGVDEQVHEPDWYMVQLADVATRAAQSCVLVAVGADGSVAGCVTYVSGPDDPYSEELRPGQSGIRMLGVDPQLQGRGIGRLLVEACIERARLAGRSSIALHTGRYMTAAQRLYERLGFRREPSLDWRPLPDIELLGYVLDL